MFRFMTTYWLHIVGLHLWLSLKQNIYERDRFSHQRGVYRNNLKNREFDKEASQNSHLERATIVRATAASEDEYFEKKPTLSKTDSSGCFGINISVEAANENDRLFYV